MCKERPCLRFKAPANAPLITDKQEVDARYRYWRRHILLTI